MQGDASAGAGAGTGGSLGAIGVLARLGSGGTSYYRGSGRSAARAEAQLQLRVQLEQMRQSARFQAYNVAQMNAAQQQAQTGVPTTVQNISTPSRVLKDLLDAAKSAQLIAMQSRDLRQRKKAAHEAGVLQRRINRFEAQSIPTYVTNASYGLVSGGPLAGSRDDPSGTMDVRSYALAHYGSV